MYDYLSNGDEWQSPRSEQSSRPKRLKELFELSSSDDELSDEDLTGSRQKKTEDTTNKSSNGAEKDRTKMHCPICSKDIYHLLRHLRQKHISPNPVQRLYVRETSKAGYI